MACMPVVIFYLIWLVNTSEGIRSEEGTLLDLVCWPDGNAIPVIIACGSVIAVVIEVSNNASLNLLQNLSFFRLLKTLYKIILFGVEDTWKLYYFYESSRLNNTSHMG